MLYMTKQTPQQTRELILSFFPPEKREEHSVESLSSIVQDFICGTNLATRLNAFIQLREWTAASLPLPGREPCYQPPAGPVRSVDGLCHVHALVWRQIVGHASGTGNCGTIPSELHRIPTTAEIFGHQRKH